MRSRGPSKRWVEVARLPKPAKNQSEEAMRTFDLASAAIVACTKVGKTVRVEKSQFGEGFRFLVRRG